MRLKLTDKRIDKLRSKSTIEVWDTDLRGFGIRINRGGKRTFNVHTRVNGKKKRFVLGTYRGYCCRGRHLCGVAPWISSRAKSTNGPT